MKPSDQVAEIVPLDGQLIVEAKVSPKDIAFVRPELPAVIKFTHTIFQFMAEWMQQSNILALIHLLMKGQYLILFGQ